MSDTDDDAAALGTVNCRHCGAPKQLEAEGNPDWQCPVCELWQDTIACPVCHQPARISLLPAEVVPPPHAPLTGKKASSAT